MTGRYNGILPFYDTNGVSTRDSNFSVKYGKMVESVETEFNDSYVEKVVDFLKKYPKVELEDILNNRIKISKRERTDKINSIQSRIQYIKDNENDPNDYLSQLKQKERLSKVIYTLKSKLEDILNNRVKISEPDRADRINNIQSRIQYIKDNENDPKDYLLQPKEVEKLSELLYILKSKTDGYALEVFSQNDPIKKMSKWASKVGICWSESELDEFPKRYLNDIKESGGTIIFCVKKGKTPVVFGRSFIGRDRNNRIYLFIDNIEGKDYRHFIDSWAEEEPGAFKVALAASFFFAEKMGCQYLVAGDEGAEEAFVSIGTSKRNISVSGRNIKIGYKTSCFSQDKDELKALNFSQDKYHYISLV